MKKEGIPLEQKKKTSRAVFVILNILFALFDIYLSIVQDIIVYEATEGIQFNWKGLVENKLLCVFLLGHILLIIWTVIVECRQQKDEEIEDDDTSTRLSKAIEACQINLVEKIPELVARGEFETVQQVLDVYDGLNNRRGG